MNPDVSVAIISTVGVLVTGMLEAVRRQGKRTALAVATPGDHSAGEILSGLSDDLAAVADDVKHIQRTQADHGARIAVTESRLGDHLAYHARKSG